MTATAHQYESHTLASGTAAETKVLESGSSFPTGLLAIGQIVVTFLSIRAHSVAADATIKLESNLGGTTVTLYEWPVPASGDPDVPVQIDLPDIERVSSVVGGNLRYTTSQAMTITVNQSSYLRLGRP